MVKINFSLPCYLPIKKGRGCGSNSRGPPAPALSNDMVSVPSPDQASLLAVNSEIKSQD